MVWNSYKKVSSAIKNIFTPEWGVKKYPEFMQQLHHFQKEVRNIQHLATKVLVGVVGHLENLYEYEVFRRMVVLRDLKETFEKSERVPYDVTLFVSSNLTLDKVNKAIMELQPKLSDNVVMALNSHDRLFGAVWEELVKRGKIHPDAERWRHYFPRLLKRPLERWSAGYFDTHYLRVCFSELIKVFLDNAVDDFVTEVVLRYDLVWELGEEQKEKVKPFVPEKLVEIDHKLYMVWKYTPCWCIYHPCGLRWGIYPVRLESDLNMWLRLTADCAIPYSHL